MFDVAQVRRELNLTQSQLAEKLGVSQGTVSKFETGGLPLDKRTQLALEALRRAAA